MGNKSKDLYYEPDALATIKKKISSLHGSYINSGPASDDDNVNSSSVKIRNILNSLDDYDDSYDNCFSKYNLSLKAIDIYNKSQHFQEKWLAFDEAFVNACELLNESTTTATTILNEFEGPPRINSPYDYANYLEKQGKKEEADSIWALIAAGGQAVKKNAAKNASEKDTGANKTEKGTSSFISSPNQDTGAPKGNVSSPVVKNHFINPDKQHDNDPSKDGEELFHEKDESSKKEEELLHKERELSDRETALDTHEKQLEKKEKELNEREKELDQREKELQEREEKLKDKEDSVNPTFNPNNQGEEQNPDPNPTKTEPNNEAPTPNETQPAPREEAPATHMNNPQPNNSYQNNNSQVANDASQNTVATPTESINNNSNVSETPAPSQKPIVDDSEIGNTHDLFGNNSEDNKGGADAGVITDLPNTDNSSQSTKSSKGFNPVPLAVGLGAAVAGGVGVKAYKNHKENSQFDDTNEDSFTNGNRFWSEEDPSVVHTEQNELSGEDLLKEQATSPSYSAISNGNNDTWSIDENSQDSGTDNSTFDLLSNN